MIFHIPPPFRYQAEVLSCREAGETGVLSETIENRTQISVQNAVPRTRTEPVLRYWSQCWMGCVQQPGAKLNQRYWTISSAAISSDCGTVSPIALAVLRLMPNSNRLGPCTGRSPALSPFRMRST